MRYMRQISPRMYQRPWLDRARSPSGMTLSRRFFCFLIELLIERASPVHALSECWRGPQGKIAGRCCCCDKLRRCVAEFLLHRSELLVVSAPQRNLSPRCNANVARAQSVPAPGRHKREMVMLYGSKVRPRYKAHAADA